jgi:D-3-phosphoglycerate dehydrogenase
MLKKKYSKGVELRGRTIGIIGFGRIGQAVASYALGIGMKVIAFDTFNITAEIPVHIEGIDPVSVKISTIGFDEVLSSSDFISLHTPAQADGKPIISSAEISKMKDGVVVVNASRGGIIDENAVNEGLNSGKLRGVALDVFLNEPTPDAVLLKNPGLSLSPHIGAATEEAQNRISLELASQIIDTFQLA